MRIRTWNLFGTALVMLLANSALASPGTHTCRVSEIDSSMDRVKEMSFAISEVEMNAEVKIGSDVVRRRGTYRVEAIVSLGSFLGSASVRLETDRTNAESLSDLIEKFDHPFFMALIGQHDEAGRAILVRHPEDMSQNPHPAYWLFFDAEGVFRGALLARLRYGILGYGLCTPTSKG